MAVISTERKRRQVTLERKVYFYSGPRLKLVGFLSTPDDYEARGGKLPGIVLCPGPGTGSSPSLGDYHHTPKLTSWLVKAGYLVLSFHHRGVRESEGPEYRLMPMEMVEDICNAITFLQQQAEVDASRIGLWGATTGGANACYVAGIDPRVKCVVSVSGVGDCGRWQRANRRYWEWKELLEMLDEDRVTRVLTGKSRCVNIQVITGHDPATAEFTVKVREMYPEYKPADRLLSLESVEALLNYRPETVVDAISPRAAMWLCAGNDTLVPIDESQGMYERAGEPKKLVTIEGKRHHELYLNSGFERMMAYSTEWFDTYLRTG